ncbi:hypothetical protein FG386_001756 [Cryptosporidium ryanae]|uniref:uncharacterized protein n=1 Tax=Cryptosporidium ryanae TaxID=515981 RepID=UPI00351A8936|nr:hypothetical protein FG386_001756 [Cryptosporidium ryanae]
MNFCKNYLMFVKLESEADYELVNYEYSNSKGESDSKTLINIIDLVPEKICRCLSEVYERRDLFSILLHYSRKLCVYNEYSNSVVLLDDKLRPHITFLLKKYLLVMKGVIKRINQVFVNQDIITLVKDDYSSLNEEEFLYNLCYIYVPIFSLRGIKLNSIYKLFEVEINLFEELKIAFKYKTFQYLYNSLFKTQRPFSFQEKKIGKTEGNVSNIELKITALNSIQDRTSAILNIVSYKNDDHFIENELKADICNYLLKIWDEYCKLGIGESFVTQILKSKYLPSKDIKCQIIFTLLFHIKDLDLFDEVLNLLLNNSFDDYSIVYLIYCKWKSIFADKDTNVTNNKKYRFCSPDEMRISIWKNYIIKLISNKNNYLCKIQGLLLAYCFFSEITQINTELSGQELRIIKSVLSLLFEDINCYIDSTDLFESKLERGILPNSLNSGFIMCLNKFLTTIKCVANINLKSIDVARSIFYQLVSIILCDSFILEKFINSTLLFNNYKRFLFRLTKPEHLFQFEVLKNHIFLFGSIPIQAITAEIESTFEITIDFGSIIGFSVRKFESSLYYNNSIRLIQLMESIIYQINIKKNENVKNLILIYIDLLKRLLLHLINIKIIVTSKNYVQFNELDSFYSYTILFMHLYYCFKKNVNSLNEHTIRTFNSLPKPKYGKDEIISFSLSKFH